MSPPVLRARDLRLGYAGRTVVSGVDWEVRAGEFWFVLGPNGSGKTTLLRAVLGLQPPLSGRLERDPERASRERIGFVPQSCAMNPTLPTTVREFVTLGLVGLRADTADTEVRLSEALQRAGLVGGLADAAFAELSGGQRQRALVARALVRRPALLLLDEPTEGLDPRSGAAFLETLAHLNRVHGTTVVLVTHRLEIAARHATHVALIDGGRALTGPASRVLSAEATRRALGPAAARLAAAGAQP